MFVHTHTSNHESRESPNIMYPRQHLPISHPETFSPADKLMVLSPQVDAGWSPRGSLPPSPFRKMFEQVTGIDLMLLHPPNGASSARGDPPESPRSVFGNASGETTTLVKAVGTTPARYTDKEVFEKVLAFNFNKNPQVSDIRELEEVVVRMGVPYFATSDVFYLGNSLQHLFESLVSMVRKSGEKMQQVTTPGRAAGSSPLGTNRVPPLRRSSPVDSPLTAGRAAAAMSPPRPAEHCSELPRMAYSERVDSFFWRRLSNVFEHTQIKRTRSELQRLLHTTRMDPALGVVPDQRTPGPNGTPPLSPSDSSENDFGRIPSGSAVPSGLDRRGGELGFAAAPGGMPRTIPPAPPGVVPKVGAKGSFSSPTEQVLHTVLEPFRAARGSNICASDIALDLFEKNEEARACGEIFQLFLDVGKTR